MSIAITQTKVTLPRRRGEILTRHRLIDPLYDLIIDRKLIILSAPAGYGKTSLLIDMAHHVDLPFCWLSLDSLDQDLVRLIAHIIASISNRFPNFGKRSFAVLQESQKNIVIPEDPIQPSTELPDQTIKSIDRIVMVMVNELHDQVREHFSIVLDDFHLLLDTPEINYFINHFIQKMGENCHMVISSRELLSLPDLALMIARTQVAGFSFNDLAFQPEEIQALVWQNHQLRMPIEEASSLAEETEGWITGLLLSTQIMWQGTADRVRMARVSGIGLYEYLAQQVLDQQSDKVREFLLHTSVFKEFNARLCKDVFGTRKNWSKLIEEIVRNNLFVLPVNYQETWLRYHHLFRDFLLSSLKNEDPQRYFDLHRQAADVYISNGEWEKAHEIFKHLEDHEAIAELITSAGESLIQNGRLGLLNRWIDACEQEVITRYPALLSLRGYAAIGSGELPSGMLLLEEAEGIYREQTQKQELAQTLLRQAIAYRLMGNYQKSLDASNEVINYSEKKQKYRHFLAEALKTKGQCFNQIGQIKDAIKLLERSLNIYTQLKREEHVAIVNTDLGLAYMNIGKYNQSLTHYQKSLNYWKETGNLAQQANIYNNIGVLMHALGEYEHASQNFENGLQYARLSGYTRSEGYILAGIGDLYADLGDYHAAQNAYKQAREVETEIVYRFLMVCLDTAEARVALQLNDTSLARKLVMSAQKLASESESRYEQSMCEYTQGLIELKESNHDAATACFAHAADQFEQGNQYFEAVRARFLLAFSLYRSDQTDAARNEIERTFEIVDQIDDDATLVILAMQFGEVLSIVDESADLSSKTAKLLSRSSVMKQKLPHLRRVLRNQSLTVPLAPPYIQVQAFGRSNVTLNGNPISSPEWGSRKIVREMFFCLLAHPNGLTKEEIGLIFWPDGSPSQLNLRFKNTIYRLRHSLGNETVLYEDDRYVFNRRLDFEYDVESFLTKLDQAKSCKRPEYKIKNLSEAVNLYSGAYLPKVDRYFANVERANLQHKFHEASITLSELLIEVQNYSQALACVRRVLIDDPCLEEAHRLAMKIHAAMGNRAAIIRQFEQCEQALEEEVDASPTDATRKLYEELIH